MESGEFLARAIFAPQNAEKLEAAFNEEIQKAVTEGFTEEELSSAKSGILLARQRLRASDTDLAKTLATNLFIGRTLNRDADFEKKIRALTIKEVNAAMKKYLQPNRISIIKAGDFANVKSK